MIRDQKHEKIIRLQSKTVDAEFSRSVQQGLNCSPFEAEVIVKLARSTYQDEHHQSAALSPGQMVITVISELEGASRKISEASMVRVVVTIDAPGDEVIRTKGDVSVLRRHRLVRICQETLEQGGLMTVEDLAYRIFNVGERTIVRDLAELRKQEIIVPLRSTIRDIGRTVSHKEEIIRLWLSGKQYEYISRSLHHSTSSIRNYVETFKRTIALDVEGHTPENIAFLIGASSALVKAYLKLWRQEKSKAIPSRIKEVEQPFSHVIKPLKSKKYQSLSKDKKGGGHK